MSAKVQLLHGHIWCVLCASATQMHDHIRCVLCASARQLPGAEFGLQGTLSSRHGCDQSTVIQAP